jgi:hypothetical protein
MRRAQSPRIGALIALASLAVGPGCIHNHYYTTPLAGCEGTTTAVRVGSVCEVPSQVVVSGAPAADPGRTTVLANAAPLRGRRVLVSEPLSRGSGRLGWRPSGPETLATTSVDGALDDDTLKR